MNRVIAGIFVPGVDDAPLNPSQLMQIVFNEIVSECSCFTSMEACSEALLKFERHLPNEEKLFSSIENTGKDLESSELKIDPSLIVFYQVLICFLFLLSQATVFLPVAQRRGQVMLMVFSLLAFLLLLICLTFVAGF